VGHPRPRRHLPTRRSSDLAAEEAELGEAVLNGGVTGQVTGLLLFEGDAVDVGGDLLGADIAGGDVNADDVDVGVFLSRPGDGGTDRKSTRLNSSPVWMSYA